MHSDSSGDTGSGRTRRVAVSLVGRTGRSIQTIVGSPATPPPAYRFLKPPARPDEIGRLGGYRILRLLGKGGMAYVFLAEDEALHRRVALKVMKPELDGEPTAADRFLREARIAAKIKHDNLVTIFQVGQEGAVAYLAMEWLQGETLDAFIDRTGPARAEDIVRLGREMAAGLDAIHRQGLVHRDIKPNNIWLEDRRGEEHAEARVKLLDFGLARHVEDDVRYTKSGNIVGTPAFMSPEQARGERLDARSDLFSLGGVLYYMATGRLPFQGETAMAVLTALAICDPVPVTDFNPELPKGLVAVIDELLSKDPAGRPSSAREVFDRLLRVERSADTVNLAARKSDDWDFSETEAMPLGPRSRKYVAAKRKAASKRKAVKWSLAIGLLLGFVIGTSIAISAALKTDKSEKQEKAEAQKVAPPATGLSFAKKDTPVAPAQKAPLEVRKAYLFDMKPSAEKDWISTPPQPKFGEEPPPPDARGVMFRGRPAPKGIFMHPPFGPQGGISSISYRIGKKYDQFQAQVTLNDGPGGSDTPLIFTVHGDDRVLWRSKPVSTQSDTQTCSVSVKDVDTLTIEVDCPGGSRGAHAAWIDPLVTTK